VKGDYKAENTKLNPAVRDQISAAVIYSERGGENAIRSQGASGDGIESP
jgi:hypothetical protein